jgi:hypothetical protein
MWDTIKDAAYVQKPRNVEHMKALISTEFAKLHMNKNLCSAICICLFNDAFSSSEYTPLNERMTENNGLERMCKEAIVA